MRIVKIGLKYMILFAVTVALLTGALVCSALIPRAAIKENVRQSAEFLCEGELFDVAVEGVAGSKIDRYADSILLAIAYQYDSEQPLSSIMWSSYYYSKYQNENQNLLDAVIYDYEPNQQYLRYWHGSNVLVRSLLLFFNIQEIYLLNGFILAVLTTCLLVMLVKRRIYIPTIGIAAGMILTSSWFVPFSLEYTWTYFLMLVFSIIVVKWSFLGRWNWIVPAFMIVGMLTSYMDFLSTETLTLLVPLLLVVWIDINVSKNNLGYGTIKNVIKTVMAWCVGYAGMWGMKWMLASVVLKEKAMPYVTEHILERVSKTAGDGRWDYVKGALWRNVKCLFPMEYGELGWLVGMICLLGVCYIGYVYHKKGICRERIILYVAIGAVPYLRYIVLSNHSYLHYFFTYRAQLATVVACTMLLAEITDVTMCAALYKNNKPRLCKYKKV